MACTAATAVDHIARRAGPLESEWSARGEQEDERSFVRGLQVAQAGLGLAWGSPRALAAAQHKAMAKLRTPTKSIARHGAHAMVRRPARVAARAADGHGRLDSTLGRGVIRVFACTGHAPQGSCAALHGRGFTKHHTRVR